MVGGKAVGAATLAILALLAVSSLGSRHQLDDVRRAVTALADNATAQVPADRYLFLRPPPLDDELRHADDICLLGVTLTRTVRDQAAVLEERLRAGATVRVVVIDADSTAGDEAVARTRSVTDKTFYRTRVRSTVDLLRILAESAPDGDRLQLRALPFVPTFGMCLLDPNHAQGRAFVELYLHKSLESHPVFVLRADRDGQRFRRFAQQFDVLWASGRPVPLAPE